MKKIIVTAVLLLICFLLQSSVFPAIALNGIVPNLLIILTASLGFMKGERSGLLIGFFCGLLLDIFGGGVIGFYALIYMYIGFINGKFHQIFYPEDIKLPLLLIFSSDLLYNFICYVFLFLLRGRLQFLFYLQHVILPEGIYTILISFLAYPLFLHLYRKLEDSDTRSAA